MWTGGIGIRDPVESAQCAYTTSRDTTAAISALIEERTEFSIQTQWKTSKSTCETTWEQRTYNEVKLNATLKPMNAKWAIIRAVESKTLSWQSYLLPATTLTYLLQSFSMPYRALHCYPPSLNDASSLWWLWTCLQPRASPGLQERWPSDPKAQWSKGCTWRNSISIWEWEE